MTTIPKEAPALVQPLPDGLLDIVADIHGEIDALRNLLRTLGYSPEGEHPDGRRLVFLGDLVDRGPDSPAVVDLVRRLVESGCAQCVLGNHEFNILKNDRKQGNKWFYGEEETLSSSGERTPQILADENSRRATQQFFRTLPLALEREDIRVVHAAWDDDAIERCRRKSDVLCLFHDSVTKIEAEFEKHDITDRTQRNLAYQNDNPVRLLASGPEMRATDKFYANGKWRTETRVPWWDEYDAPAFCVFGHYWRTPPTGDTHGPDLFAHIPPHAVLGRGRAMCIDYSVGGRWSERIKPEFQGSYQTRLAALRWPERMLLFDTGESTPLEPAPLNHLRSP